MEKEKMVSELETYLFDLRGYIIIKGALSQAEVGQLNAELDGMPRLEPGQWHGRVHAHSYGTKDGLNYQQIYEGGEPFEKLIDHPSWIDHIKFFVGGEGTFDYHHGPLFIDECFAHFRQAGEAIGLHSGGHPPIHRNQFRYHGGRFMCGQVNVLMALTDIGDGDGGTMVIPGSHKSNFAHPHMEQHRMKPGGSSVDGTEGAIHVHLDAGDALVFVDGISHGSAKRTNDGERRVIIFRYGPSWGNFRHGYSPSPELLERLTPARRKIVQPLDLIPRPTK
jgi:hypothetical protein